MPSLPSLPAFEDSAGNLSESEAGSDNRMLSTVYSEPEEEDLAPVQSTPAPILSRTMTSAARMPSSTSSTARFASSIASRSANGRSGNYGSASLSRATSASAVKGRRQESFDVSVIPSLPGSAEASEDEEREQRSGRQSFRKSKDSVPDMYLPPEEEAGEPEYSLTEALESVSRASSPFSQDLDEHRSGLESNATPKKAYDYSIALRSEPKVCGFLFHVVIGPKLSAIGLPHRQISQCQYAQTIRTPPHQCPYTLPFPYDSFSKFIYVPRINPTQYKIRSAPFYESRFTRSHCSP